MPEGRQKSSLHTINPINKSNMTRRQASGAVCLSTHTPQRGAKRETATKQMEGETLKVCGAQRAAGNPQGLRRIYAIVLIFAALEQLCRSSPVEPLPADGATESFGAIPVYSDAVALVGRWAAMGLPSIGCVDATPSVSMPAARFTFMQAAGVIEGGTAQGFWVCGGTIIYEFNAAAVWATWYGWTKPDPGNATDSVCTFRFCANSSPMSISVEVEAFTVVGVVAP